MKTAIALGLMTLLNAEDDLELQVENPFRSAESNSYAYRTLSESLDFGLGYLADEVPYRDYPAWRLSETLFALSADNFLCVLSHEMGHYRTNLLDGWDSKIVMSPFKGFLFHGGQVEYTNNFDSDLCSVLDSGGEGVNQNTLNASLIWSQTRARMDLIDDVGYLNNKLCCTVYDMLQSGRGDIGIYYAHLRDLSFQKFDSKDEFVYQRMINGLVLSALDFQLYEALYHIFDYVSEGNRVHEPFCFEIGEFEVYPPSFQHYLASRGEFANMQLCARYDSFEFVLDIGRDLDWTQPLSRTNTVRVGLLAVLPFEGFTFFPFASVNTTSDIDFEFVGGSFGAGMHVPIANTGFGLTAVAGIYENDVLENDIKGKEDGFSVALRLTYDL